MSVKYADIESLDDLLAFVRAGNQLTASQVSFLSNKLDIDRDRVAGIARISEPAPVDKPDDKSLTSAELLNIFTLEDITELSLDGRTFDDFQIKILAKSLRVPEASINNAIEQGFAELPGDVKMVGPAGGPGAGGATLASPVPLTDVDFDSIPPSPSYIFGSYGGKPSDSARVIQTTEGNIVLPLNYEDTITYLIGIGVNVKFLGLDSPGYPLGYRSRQEGGALTDDKYGDFPVYLPDMADSLFGDLITSETEIISLQRKLVNAGYLTTTFEPGKFDAATEQATEIAMGVHNSEGRTPNVPEIAGALLDFYGVKPDGTAVDSTMYGFTPERALEIKQFLLNELDVDIQNEDQRIRDDLVVEAPRLDEEQAAYTMLQVLQQQYGSLGIRYDNISNASTLVNKLLKNVAVESKIKEKESIAASKRAAEAALDKETRLNVLRRANPNLSDDELKELYPETFAIETVDVVGELGPFGEGVGNFRENLFANRLQRSMQDLLQPELDLNEKRNNINQATSNFYRAARGARNLVQSAPSLNRGINT